MPLRCEWGDPAWHANAKKKATGDATAAEGQSLLAPPRPRRRKVSPSKMDAEHALEGQMGADGGMICGVDAAEFGTAVHGLFEQVEWLGEECPRWLTEPQSAEERLVAAALQVPEVRALFARQEGQVVYNEQNIDAIQGENWISGTLDRLVVTHGADGAPRAASIIDFKTDIRRGDTGAEQDACLRDTHRAQMKTYHSLIRQAFHLPAEAVSVTLISCPRDGAPARAVRYSAAELQS